MDIISLRLPVLLITVIINTFLAIVVLKNDSKNATNRIFAILSVVTGLWLIDLYISVNPTYVQHGLLWVRLSIFLAALQVALFFLLAHTLPNRKLLLKKKQLVYLVLATLAIMLLTLSPFAFTEVNIDANDQVKASSGPAFGLFAVFAISLSCATVYTLLRKLWSARGHARAQYRYVVYGLIVMLGLLISTVLIPIALFKYSGFVVFAPLYTIIFLGFTTFAIIKHQLFDIRRVIARSVAYLLLVTTFVVTYTISVLMISYFVFNNGHIDAGQHITYILLTLLFTPTVYWLKKSFDRVTNRLFFHDAYDAQDFLDQLNEVLVSTIETDTLLSQSAQLIGRTIKSEFCLFSIKATNGKPQRIISDASTDKLNLKEAELLQECMPMGLANVLVADKVPDDCPRVREFMRKNDVGAFARLANTSQMSGAGYGYLVLGVKKSGNPYSQQDIKTMEIMTDELTIAIQNALRFEEIEKFNIKLEREVEAATRKLHKTNENLKLLDETKDEFISLASHQLRTPLTSVKGYVSMVLEGDAGKISPLQHKLLNQAFISSQRMVYLISDLLNVSRLRTGKFIIEPMACNLAEIVDSEVKQLVETARLRELELIYDKPEQFSQYMLDETKLRQVIMNFIDNAIYYTPAGGHITIHVADKPQSIEFTVVDTGLGVPRHEQHRLFAKFYRAGNAKRARPDGTGLGLFMAKKVVIAHGGAIIFRSQEGKGSTFGFSFAKQKLEPVPEKSSSTR